VMWLAKSEATCSGTNLTESEKSPGTKLTELEKKIVALGLSTTIFKALKVEVHLQAPRLMLRSECLIVGVIEDVMQEKQVL